MNTTDATFQPLDPRTFKQAQACVHCGLCLPACPTYTQNGLETDSPRGRIYLMKALSEGRVGPTASVMSHLDLCLDCRACETACPSGVKYHELIEETRAQLEAKRQPEPGSRLMRWIIFHVLPYPWRMKLAILPARVAQRLGMYQPIAAIAGKVLGRNIAKMQQMLPPSGPLWPGRLQERYPATGEKKLKVGFVATCAGSVLATTVNRKTVELLQYLGCEVIVPREQECCGAIFHHGGRPADAAELARRNIAAFRDCDLVVNNVAGCGAMLKEYDHLLRDDPVWAEHAAAFTKKVRDINELLVELKPPAPRHRLDMIVTYHDACHLAHGQKITNQPRQLLASIPGLTVVPLPESDMCCGAAGTYNLQQPEMSTQLAERKVRHIQSTSATVVVSSNIGCTMQIASEAAQRGIDLRVMHPVELLHAAYLGPTQGRVGPPEAE